MNNLDTTDIKNSVTHFKKIIDQLDAQMAIAKNAVDLIQKTCDHIVTTQVGPHEVCDACQKII